MAEQAILDKIYDEVKNFSDEREAVQWWAYKYAQRERVVPPTPVDPSALSPVAVPPGRDGAYSELRMHIPNVRTGSNLRSLFRFPGEGRAERAAGASSSSVLERDIPQGPGGQPGRPAGSRPG